MLAPNGFLLAALVLLTPRAAGGQDLLRPGAPVEAGPGSGELLLADLDGDGHVDLLSRHLVERRIAVHRGRGDGSFEANHRSLPLPWEPGAVDLGDIDRDGHADLVIATRDSASEWVRILRGAPSGFASPARAISIRTHASMRTWKPVMKLLDVNGDGRLDIAVANGRRASIEILLGNGAGSFTPHSPVPLAAGGERYDFDLGDTDRDGDIDIVTTGSIESSGLGFLQIHAREARGWLRERRDASVTLPSSPRGATLTDMDGDGDLDLISGHAEPRASVFLNDGRGRFVAAQGSPFPLPGPAYSVVAADMNADGRPDLVAATAGSVTVMLAGSRGFSHAQGSPYPAGPGAFQLVAGDINADGAPDVVASSFEGTSLSILLGNPERD